MAFYGPERSLRLKHEQRETKYDFNGLYDYDIFNDIMKLVWDGVEWELETLTRLAGLVRQSDAGVLRVDGCGVFRHIGFFYSLSNVASLSYIFSVFYI